MGVFEQSDPWGNWYPAQLVGFPLFAACGGAGAGAGLPSETATPSKLMPGGRKKTTPKAFQLQSWTAAVTPLFMRILTAKLLFYRLL